MNTEIKTIEVKGMHCEGCENRVKKVLSEIPGVSIVQVSHSESKVTLEVTEDVSIKYICNKIKSLGYKVKCGDIDE